MEHQLSTTLPGDYRAFLQETNGLEGFISAGTYLMLWSTEQIPELNQGYAVSELAPGLVLLGTDGGDTGYGFVRRPRGTEYVRVPLVGLSVEAAESLGSSVDELLGRLGG